MSQSHLPINNPYVTIVTTVRARTLDHGVTAANQRCMQAAAAEMLKSYAADLLSPSAVVSNKPALKT